jgi:DNA-binding IclR family transcriptional regulator
LRLARSLEHGGFLYRHPDGCFAVGAEPLRLSAVYKRSLRLEEHVRPVLRLLVAETGESASFFRREGDRRLCLYREETARAIRDHIIEGDLLPLDIGAAGHVLRGSDDSTARECTPKVSTGERDAETAAIAAPVFDHLGMAGALTLSGPRGRFGEERVPFMAALLCEQAGRLSTRLGG